MKKQLLLFSTFLFLLLSNVLVAQTLVHYWNFNNSGSETEILTPTLGLVAGAGIQHIQGGSSAIQTTSNTGNGFDTANPNARKGDPSGAHLRFNNPIGGALIFSIPTAGYQQIVVKYGTRRSGSGAGAQIIEYATDGASFIPFATINPVDGDPTLQTLDFSGISAANDNADFKIRITFEQGPGGTVGNNRFDNFTLEGITFGADTVSPVVTFDPVDGSTGVSPLVQPKIIFNEEIRLVNDSLIKNEDILALVQLREDHAAGNPVTFSGTYANKTLTLTPDAALINNKTYFMALLPNTVEDFSNNTLDTLISVQFTIIPQQTVFQAGDIVPIAYRMNATGSEDEVAFLTFVNILPGTKINMTDAKFTDNSPAQCPGGITWTSPGSILPAGSVFVVQNDAGSASVGTVTGSTFGLSSNGDQMLVYTGSNTTPTYITALSSNAWVTGAHTACGGSFIQASDRS